MARSEELKFAFSKLQVVLGLLGPAKVEEISDDFRGKVILPRKLSEPKGHTKKFISPSGRIYFLKEENAK